VAVLLLAGGRIAGAALVAVVVPFGLRHVMPLLRHRGPRLFIDERGVEDLLWPFGLIAWEDIHSVHLQACGRDVAFCVVPRDPSRLTRDRPRMLRWTDAIASFIGGGRSPAHVRLRLLVADEEELFEFLLASGLLERTAIGAAAHVDPDDGEDAF